jgi:electron transfer flavoprotein alpha subunit
MLYDLNVPGEYAVVMIGKGEYFIGNLEEQQKQAYVARLSIINQDTPDELVVDLWKEIIVDVLDQFNELKVIIDEMTGKQLEYITIYLQNALL